MSRIDIAVKAETLAPFCLLRWQVFNRIRTGRKPAAKE
jgi:hypothetical protein